MTSKLPRIAILKEAFIPHYRVRLYELLGAMPDVDYVVVHGQAPAATAHRAAPGPFSFSEIRSSNRELRMAGKTLAYQPVVRTVAGPGFDGAVIGSELKLLANTALFPILKAKRRPVLLWGQGGEKREDLSSAMSLLSGAGALAKRTAARHADGYLSYTQGGRDRLVESGVDPAKIFVIRNTLDIEREIELHRQMRDGSEEQLRHELGLQRDSIVLLYIGRVYREKRLPEFISLIRALRDPGSTDAVVEGVVIGDGPDLEAVRQEAGDIDGLHLPGEIRDGELIAKHMRAAAALVIPGKVGLAVNHAFGHGVPVITRTGDLHAPEFEYLEPERNSIVVSGDFDDFVRAVAEFVDAPERQRLLSAGALASREGLTIAGMASAFHRAVCTTLKIQQ